MVIVDSLGLRRRRLPGTGETGVEAANAGLFRQAWAVSWAVWHGQRPSRRGTLRGSRRQPTVGEATAAVGRSGLHRIRFEPDEPGPPS